MKLKFLDDILLKKAKSNKRNNGFMRWQELEGYRIPNMNNLKGRKGRKIMREIKKLEPVPNEKLRKNIEKYLESVNSNLKLSNGESNSKFVNEENITLYADENKSKEEQPKQLVKKPKKDNKGNN